MELVVAARMDHYFLCLFDLAIAYEALIIRIVPSGLFWAWSYYF